MKYLFLAFALSLSVQAAETSCGQEQGNVMQLLSSTAKVIGYNNDTCAEKLQSAILYISSLPGTDGISGADIAANLVELINSGKIEIFMDETQSNNLGYTDQFEGNKITLNCSRSAEVIGDTLVHEVAHLMVSDSIRDTDLEASFKRGVDLLNDYHAEPIKLNSWDKNDWRDSFSLIYVSMFQEIYAYSFASKVTSDKFQDKERLRNHLNNAYFMPRYKFAVGKETFERMLGLIENGGEDLRENLTNFSETLYQTHSPNLKIAMLFKAKQ